ncbi:MAG TPA: hypothetical protein VGQ81_08445, partial [Acidobacteriota bacterium]|nr:hypothetical protein [Acidobacteriota bacterium]
VFWGGRQKFFRKFATSPVVCFVCHTVTPICCIEGNAPGRALELRNSVARPKKQAGLMAWKNDRSSQGSASSALGLILPPSQKAAGLGSDRSIAL